MKWLGTICLLFLSASVLAAESSVYDFSWLDQDKEVYVLQNRKFRKSGDFYIGATFEKNANQAFVDSLGASFLAGFFFKEDWGIEFVYNKQSGEENNTFENVQDGSAGTPFYRKIDSYMGAMLMWSPFYSKINTFNKVFYYDWLFGAGVASINTQTNENDFLNPSVASGDGLVSESGMGFIWTSGMRFYINDSWSIRLDVRGLHSQTERPKSPSEKAKEKVWFHNYDFGFGLNYAF